METRKCPICGRPPPRNQRARFCSPQCRWQGYWGRCVEAAERIDQLPLTILPPNTDEFLPSGSERTLVALRIAVLGRAPAGARGYRVGIKYGRSNVQRWFPVRRLNGLPMFRLDPFEWPAVPVAGTYAVTYLDVQHKPIGGPRFAVAIDHVDERLRYSDGDRRYRPRTW